MNNLKYFIKQSGLIRSGIKKFSGSIPPIAPTPPISVRTPLLKFNKIPNTLKNGLKFELSKKVQDTLPVSGSNSDNATLKKRSARKKKFDDLDEIREGFNVIGFATAEEYDLEKLIIGLKVQDLYEPKKFFSSTDSQANEPDVLYVTGEFDFLRSSERFC